VSDPILYNSKSRHALLDPNEMVEEQLLNTIGAVRRKIEAGQVEGIAFERLPDGTTQPAPAAVLLADMCRIADVNGWGTAKPPVPGQFPNPGHP